MMNEKMKLPLYLYSVQAICPRSREKAICLASKARSFVLIKGQGHLSNFKGNATCPRSRDKAICLASKARSFVLISRTRSFVKAQETRPFVSFKGKVISQTSKVKAIFSLQSNIICYSSMNQAV